MKNNFYISSTIGVLFLLVFHTSCTIETATAPVEKKLVIVSDFLSLSDSTLFDDFAQTNETDVQLKIMSSKDIKNYLEMKKANSGIDVVLSESLLSAYQLDKKGLLQHINLLQDIPQEFEKYSSQKYNYIGIAINPFVIVQPVNSRKRFRTYDELIANGFINRLNGDHSEVFLAPYMHKMKKVDANKKIRSFVKKSIISVSDSLRNTSPILINLRQYTIEKKRDSLLFNREMTYPNQLTSGSFYNIINATIVDQAENYTEAKQFLHYICQEKNNKRFNGHLGTISIYASENQIRLQATKREKLIPYMGMVERTLKKLNYQKIN